MLGLAANEDPEIASSKGLTRAELADHLPARINDLVDYLQTFGEREYSSAGKARGPAPWGSMLETALSIN